MKTIGSIETSRIKSSETVIHFEEGLIGFADIKDFRLLEAESLSPFRLLTALDLPEIGFVVLDPVERFPDFCHRVPRQEWDPIGVSDPKDGQAFVTVVLGPNPEKSTGNFQAPLLINPKEMIGKQIILSCSGYSIDEPLI